MIQSVVSVQREIWRRERVKITLDEAREICLNNPFLEPIEGNWDKFKMVSPEEVQEVIQAIKEEQIAKEEAEEDVE